MTQAEKNAPVPATTELERLRARVVELERENQTFRAAEFALRQSEELNRRIIDCMLGGLVQVSMDGSIHVANAEAARILGLGIDELTMQNLIDYAPVTIYEDGSPCPVEEYPASRCLATGLPQPPMTIGLQHVDGNTIWAVFTAAPLRDLRTEELIGAVVTFMDVTEQRATQNALRQSEARLRAIFDYSPAAIYMKDVKGRFIEFSHQAQVWTGKGRDEVIGRTVYDIFPKEMADQFTKEDHEILQSRRMIASEREILRRDGLQMHLGIKFPLLDNLGNVYAICGISTDISERKRIEEALQHSTELQRLMLSELDHRVRNNLASLLALIDISKRDSQSVADFAASVKGRVQAMSAVHGLLSRARWFAVGLRSLIHSLIPHDMHDFVHVDGPNVMIPSRQVTALGMLIQELMANSLKYGALRHANGRINVLWTMSDSTDQEVQILELTWQETGGPPIEHVPASGQGTELICGLVKSELRGKVEMCYPYQGACHRFQLFLDRIA